MTRTRAALIVIAVTAVWLTICLLSLRWGWLHPFFFDTDHARVQGIDFFPVERAWLNLVDGHSQYDTFHQAFGPYATWYLYHPVLVLFVGPLLMAFSPWTAYATWVGCSVLLLAAAAAAIAMLTEDALRRALIGLVLVGSFPGYLILYSGNIQSLTVLALALVLAAVYRMGRNGSSRGAEAMLLCGLLLSLFSKPFALGMLPLLLLLAETRRAALRACLLYAGVSAACLVVPGMNPAASDWATRWNLLTHPALVQQTMNVYTNGFTVTTAMQDNFVHWLAMAGLADFRMAHLDVYSLPTLLDSWWHTHTPASLYRVPALLLLEATSLIACMLNNKARLSAALDLIMASSLLLFLSYGLVWEYHYAGVLPIVAVLLVKNRGTTVDKLLIALGLLNWLPSLYVVLRDRGAWGPTSVTLLHAERVIPVLLMFGLLLARAVHLALTHLAGLRFVSKSTELPALEVASR